MGVALLVLIAIGVFLSPELRTNPIAVGLAILTLLGAAGILYGKWRDFQAREAIIELNERDKRR